VGDESPIDKFLGKAAEGLYEDGLKTSVSNIGETIGFLFKAISYYPRFWGKVLDIKWEDKVEQFEQNFKENMSGVPTDQIQLPPPSIAGPVVQALEYAIFDDELASLFAKLLSTSMDARVSQTAHPSFAEIIKQISADEARILKYLKYKPHEVIAHVKYHEEPSSDSYSYFAKNISLIPLNARCHRTDLGQAYLENLSRLGLIEIPINWWYGDEHLYEELSKWFEGEKESFRKGDLEKGRFSMEKSTLRLTTLGSQFVNACVG
jgi:Abortive infection alpha